MPNVHHFNLDLEWSLNTTPTEARTTRISRNHTVEIVGKPILNVSAAKAFKGDPSLYNPEDLLLASLASCHMMSYLYCCSLHKMEVLAYTDNAEALLEVNMDGSGKIIKVMLKPIIVIAEESDKDLALSLHEDANKLCFIANSCNFPVEHFPIIQIQKK